MYVKKKDDVVRCLGVVADEVLCETGSTGRLEIWGAKPKYIYPMDLRGSLMRGMGQISWSQSSGKPRRSSQRRVCMYLCDQAPG